GNINLNGQSINLNSTATNATTNVSVGGGSQRAITGTGTVSITGTVTGSGFATMTVSAESVGSSLLFDNSVTITTALGVDFGASGITLINAIFQIDANGFVIGNAPDYGNASTLIYNNGSGGYNRNYEWNANVSGAGFPNHVIVQNNTPLNLDFYSNSGLGTSGYLDIKSGSSVSMGNMGNALSVGTDLTLAGTLTLSNTSGGDLNVARNWNRTSSGVLTQNNRNVTFNGSENATITASGGQLFSHVFINKSALANTVTLVDSVNVSDVIGFTRGTLNLANNNVTLLSTSSKTARVDQITTPSNISLNYSGTGAFVIQRHLPVTASASARRWRLLTAPITTTGAPSINQAWQEGQVSVDRNAPLNAQPGYGLTITKSTVSSNGFDQGIQNNPSIYRYVSNAWIAPNATNTGAITDNEGYMLFVRGDRSVVVTGPYDVPNSTTLRVKGRLNIGGVNKALNASGLQILGNPYASAISLNNTTFNGQSPATTAGLSFYIWDPKMAGASNVGNFVTFTSLGNGTYSVVPNVGGSVFGTGGIIESGSAFMVDAAGGTFSFVENCKVSSNSTVGIASRPTGAHIDDLPSGMSRITVNLLIGANANAPATDGVSTFFGNDFEDELNWRDAKKLFSFSGAERLSIFKDSTRLSVEFRKPIQANDTLNYHISRLNQSTYQFDVEPQAISPLLVGILEDQFLSEKTVLNLQENYKKVFNISSNPSSGATNRFRIIFKDAVRFIDVNATTPDRDILVKFTLVNEFGVARYEIEQSMNNGNFDKVATINSLGNNENAVQYAWLNEAPAPGIYTYRIKAVLNNGSIIYSDKVTVSKVKTSKGIYVYPNPSTGNVIGLNINDMPAGNYQVRLMAANGTVVYNTVYAIQSGLNKIELKPNYHLATGVYQLELIHQQKNIQKIKLFVE
ncbi:MAG: T9SS type A sorting domain-containing protein, partial [Ferruginibacter sp.]